ncbi:FAD-dependent monooxygenase [Kitasatospora sp. LaBMicrA B282]|uniref:FAD-dependent monooxygenase n=1 Tax=Kitasatospora sp. LaBMicrA B282 TaxID=3420949 RepID=UPI003D11518E
MHADALVVGAGIAGLTTAARLLRLGLRVDVVDRADEVQAAGAGIMLHPNALAHLDHLGPALHAAGRPIAHQVTNDPDGTASVLDWAAVWGGPRLPLAIRRRTLSELMLHHLPADTVRWSTEPTALTQAADHVEVAFADGERRRYAVVLGADGINSWTRQYVDPAAEPHYLGHLYWRTTIESAPPFDFDDWRIWRAGGHFFGGMPIGGGRHHVFLQADLAEPRRVAPEHAYAELAAIAATMGPAVRDLVRSLDPADSYNVRPAQGLSVRRWVNGRVALVGDAAHSFSPATTQGGAMAIEDTSVLAEELARRGATPQALDAYQARRQPRVRDFARLARLHGVLSAAVQANLGPGRGTPGGAAAPAGSAAWFRRLYRPLMEAA